MDPHLKHREQPYAPCIPAGLRVVLKRQLRGTDLCGQGKLARGHGAWFEPTLRWWTNAVEMEKDLHPPREKNAWIPNRVGFGNGGLPLNMASIGINSLDFWSVIPTLKSFSSLTMFSRKSPEFPSPNWTTFCCRITKVTINHIMLFFGSSFNNRPTGTENTFSSSSSVDTAAWKRGWLMAKGHKSGGKSPLGIL